MSAILVLTTVPNRKEARKIADRVLSARVAACVNILSGIESHYWWQGKKEKAGEVALLIKTRKSLYKQLEKVILKVHSYGTPEIIAFPISNGNPAYLKWLRSETKS
ncbi:MAG: divalent-cation tolerance protein CutA [Candidatus Omnitrophota bacterium]|nr:divalent-cation tolerance protein CutA [Candidatus Omnitrophota bacterium]